MGDDRQIVDRDPDEVTRQIADLARRGDILGLTAFATTVYDELLVTAARRAIVRPMGTPLPPDNQIPEQDTAADWLARHLCAWDGQSGQGITVTWEQATTVQRVYYRVLATTIVGVLRDYDARREPGGGDRQ